MTVTGTNDKSRTLRIGVLANVGTLDPRELGDTITGLVLGQIFEMAYRVTPTGAIEPHLFAEPLREERSGPQPVYSAPVREGIVFSDGTPLTAQLAAASLAKAGALRGRATVSARDNRVHFAMSGPSPRFENVLTQWNCGIVLEKGGSLHGTGPYRFPAPVSMHMLRDVRELRLVRNARYHGTAHADELIFAIYPPDPDGTPTRLIEAAKQGELDITLHLAAHDVIRYNISGFHPMMQPGNSTGFLFLNCEKPMFRDASLRRALRDAVDPVPIAEVNYEKNHFAFLARDIIPLLMAKPTGTIPARDRELLRKHPAKPARIQVVMPWAPRPYLPKPGPSAEELVRQLAAYGIDVQLKRPRNSEETFRILANGDYDIGLGGWVADNPDPTEFYESLLSSAQVSRNGQYLTNLARWSDPATDAALAAFRIDPSPANRKVITDLIESQAMMVPLIYGASTAIRARRVKEFHITPSGHVSFGDVMF
ncbi:MAG: ABC transporter substrate-binding protein [Acidobacteriota bacterium]|nr:ABC transporter substrate-binding protein [Acidobacteriota bacterium]